MMLEKLVQQYLDIDGLTDEEKVLKWVRWAVELSSQGQDRGSSWNIMGELILPLAERLLG